VNGIRSGAKSLSGAEGGVIPAIADRSMVTEFPEQIALGRSASLLVYLSASDYTSRAALPVPFAVMVMQAKGVTYTAERDPTRARQAAQTIATIGRTNRRAASRWHTRRATGRVELTIYRLVQERLTNVRRHRPHTRPTSWPGRDWKAPGRSVRVGDPPAASPAAPRPSRSVQ